MPKWWMVRAGDNTKLIPEWREKGIAAIAWPALGDPSQYQTKDDLLIKASEAFPDSRLNSRRSWVGQVWRFSREIEIGDRVITYFKKTREYSVGTVTKAHFFDEIIGGLDFPNNIKVKWASMTVKRDQLSQQVKNSLGSALTVYRIDALDSEFGRLLGDSVMANHQ